ncbi:unnamed protein product [Acanthoscelides obtectus]|uniref:Uncharacterized protein n=1 Tax=Acanthoscelides obtectus TaxID=200917 RepID=A0A9P0LNY1_ACAOB|nr:unnamed protein product [Acanthoscelides obtectus]CAK1624155.1 hypothetical protein AOBTE_LOCUS2355 [Acanthoscelides obtectus]
MIKKNPFTGIHKLDKIVVVNGSLYAYVQGAVLSSVALPSAFTANHPAFSTDHEGPVHSKRDQGESAHRYPVDGRLAMRCCRFF